MEQQQVQVQVQEQEQEQQEEEGEPIYVMKLANEWGRKLGKMVNSGLEEAWDIVDENRVLINELDHNRDSETGDDLALNIALLGELNENMHRAAELHAGLSAALARAERNKKKKQQQGKEADSKRARPE